MLQLHDNHHHHLLAHYYHHHHSRISSIIVSQKGAITIQRCSIENQNLGHYRNMHITVIAPLWFSTEHL